MIEEDKTEMYMPFECPHCRKEVIVKLVQPQPTFEILEELPFIPENEINED